MESWNEVRKHAAGLLDKARDGGPLWELIRLGMPQYLWTDKHPMDEADIYARGQEEPVGWCTACEEWVALSEVEDIAKGMQPDPYLSDDYQIWLPVEGWGEYEFDYGYTDGKPKHKAFTVCPHCLTRVQARDMWRPRKSMRRDRRFFVTWAKSSVEEGTIVMAGFDAIADWREMDNGSPAQVLTVTPVEVCLFRPGKAGQRWICEGRWDEAAREYKTEWRRRKECISGWRPGATCFHPSWVTLCYEGGALEDAVAGTCYEKALGQIADSGRRTDAESYHDKITLMDRLSRYGCIEYLYRLGFEELGRAAIDRKDEKLLNLHGKTAQQVMRLTADEWAEVKGKKLPVDMDVLRLRKVVRENKLRMNMEAICWAAKDACSMAAGTVRRLMEGGHPDAAKAVKYCRRKNVRIRDYADLFRQMIDMGMDIKSKELLYPRDFAKEHGRYSQRIELIKAEERAEAAGPQTEKIQKRIQSGKLDEYFFGALGLVMRPMLDAREIIFEGTAQNICVGDYVEEYAEGKDILCVIRREDAQKEPLYTVEFTPQGRRVQCRGYSNSRPNPKDHLDLFWRLFEDMRGKLRQQQKKGRSKTA